MIAEHRIKAGFVLAALLLLAMAAGAGHSVRAFNSASDLALHTLQVRTALRESLSAVQDIETAARGFVLTGQDEFLEPDAAGRAVLDRTLPVLRRLTADNPSQQRQLDRLEPLIAAKLATARSAVELRQGGDLQSGAAHVATGEGRRIMDGIRDLFAQMSAMESELLQRAGQLEAANKELEAFSYSVSHDLRAPLRHIDGFSELLRKRAENSLDDQSRRYLRNISDAAKRLGLLIDELLLFSRTGRAEMRQAGVETRALLDTVIAELQQETKDRAIEWRIGELPAVQADPAMLRQVWANLLGNAVKYTGGRSAARIEVTHRADGGREHVFCVRNNGAGFDMKYAHKLFGLFSRLHSAAEFEGTGIGLANVQRIVTRHGGRVWAEGRPGEGAAFFFCLPVGSTPLKP